MAFLVERCGEMVASVDSHKGVPAPFLTKTYKLVDDPCTDHIVSWGEDETTFVVWRPPEFARDLLPNYFKHNNFSSFVRQLNTYGFRKIVADRWEFANEFFRKGHKHLLSEIHRRKTLTSQQQQQQHFTPPSDLHHHYHYHHMNLERSSSACWMINGPLFLPPPATTSCSVDGATDYLSALSEDNQRLRRNNSLLLSELTHMKKLYNDIIYFIPHHVTPVHASSPHHAGPSSVTITEEPPAATESSSIKLFGVALNGGGKKRLHPEAAAQVYSEFPVREIN